jgi:hypothetical protein
LKFKDKDPLQADAKLDPALTWSQLKPLLRQLYPDDPCKNGTMQAWLVKIKPTSKDFVVPNTDSLDPSECILQKKRRHLYITAEPPTTVLPAFIPGFVNT